jgi:glycosyltransferase involved in cell wall biosynthesis
MRVAILSATSAWGGAENHAIQLANALDARGHEVVLVELGHEIFQQKNLTLRGQIQLRHLALPKPLEQLPWKEAKSILAQVRADVCVFEKGELDAANLAFDLAARWIFKAYIVIEQLLAPTMPPKPRREKPQDIFYGWGIWWYINYLKRHSRSWAPHKIVCVSNAVRDRLQEEYRFPAAKTLTIHNCIDASLFRPNPEWRSSVRRAWNIPENDLVFGAVGRLAPIKRFDKIIELFRQFCLAQAARNAWLVLVGGGPAAEQLRQSAEQSGLANRIKFPGPTDAPWQSYNGIDVFLMTSQSEGLPLALLEAMACGCCPIGMSVGGMREVICDPEVGWLVEEGEFDRFVEAMETVARLNKDQRMAIAANGRKVISTRFNTETQMEKFVCLLESAVTNQMPANFVHRPSQDSGLSSKAQKNSSATVA